MKAARIAIALGLLATGAALYARPAPPAAGAKPQELVAARQAGMDMSATSLNLLKGASANGMPLKNLTFAASGLAKWAAAMPALFADSTKGLPGRAKAEVWTDRAGFLAKAAALQAAAKALTAAALAEDKDAFAAALATTAGSCKGCHETYQVPPPAAKAG